MLTFLHIAQVHSLQLLKEPGRSADKNSRLCNYLIDLLPVSSWKLTLKYPVVCLATMCIQNIWEVDIGEIFTIKNAQENLLVESTGSL